MQKFDVIAGPCAVESEAQIERLAKAVASTGVKMLRGGAYKPRTRPESFQGHGVEGLNWMRRAADRHGLDVVSEVLDVRHVEAARRAVDVAQIGARNMYNVPLLRKVALHFDRVLLKRHFGATLREWVGALGYLRQTNPAIDVILCERGIRCGASDETRFTLDIAGALRVKQMTGCSVYVDPSHATGRAELVYPLSAAAKAAGLDGTMIECHDQPEQALCDGEQACSFSVLQAVADLREV